MMATRTLRVVTPVPADPSPLRAPRLPTGVGPSREAKAPPVSPVRRNPWEEAARERKAAALVLSAEDLARHSGVTLPVLVASMESWGEGAWSKLAVAAGQKPPSSETRAMVLDRLHARASQQTVAPPAVPHLEIVTPSTWLGGDRFEPGETLGCARADDDPQAIADQFFPREDVTVTPGDGHGLVALIQVGDQDDEGCSCSRTIGEIWEVGT